MDSNLISAFCCEVFDVFINVSVKIGGDINDVGENRDPEGNPSAFRYLSHICPECQSNSLPEDN